MTAVSAPLRFRVGARTVAAIPRRLVRVQLTLDEVLRGVAPVLPPLPADADGYQLISLPVALLPALQAGGLLLAVRQRYTRFFVDLSVGFDAWQAQLSGSTRATLKRKAKRLAARGFTLERATSPDTLDALLPAMGAVSATSYQERLLDAGLPAGKGFRHEVLALAAADRMRGWLLSIGGAPAAYLLCSAVGDSLLYEHVGHDPRFADWSPGSVLQLEALRDLFAEERFGRFDFTEGEGQHKRQLATGGVECVDLLLLRRTFANRVALAAVGGFDRAVAFAKRAAVLDRLARRLRR